MAIDRVLAVIPARGGSKGVRRKNIRLLAGKPLIQYTIDAAQRSKTIDHLVGSTEDEEIARSMKELGCRVLKRPHELAQDDTPMSPVIQNVIDQLRDQGEGFEIIMLLQPTAPLRTTEDIDTAIRQLKASDRQSLASVYQVEDHHPSRMYTIENERMMPVMIEPKSRLRQALPPVYHRNGAIYAIRTGFFESTGRTISDDVLPYIMSMDRSVNIDSETDLMFAEFLLTRGLTV